MPFDTPFLTADELLPENLNFPVEFEPTKVADKKYVINGNTGDYDRCNARDRSDVASSTGLPSDVHQHR